MSVLRPPRRSEVFDGPGASGARLVHVAWAPLDSPVRRRQRMLFGRRRVRMSDLRRDVRGPAGSMEERMSAPTMLYCGCHGDTGHYVWDETEWSSSKLWKAQPWGNAIDGGLQPPKWRANGVTRFTQEHGWSALSWWDNSIDKRPGSHSTFIVEGEHSAEEVLALALGLREVQIRRGAREQKVNESRGSRAPPPAENAGGRLFGRRGLRRSSPRKTAHAGGVGRSRYRVVTEFDTGRGRLVWFNGPPGKRLRELRSRVVHLDRGSATSLVQKSRSAR